jgi:hypothetical protein
MQHEDTSVVHTRDISVRCKRSTASAEKAGRHSRREGKKALLKDVLGMTNIESKSRRGNSTKREATRILYAAPRATSPCMRWWFIDRRYLPSTSMDHREQEVILDELICMGYIVKEEPNSDHNK